MEQIQNPALQIRKLDVKVHTHYNPAGHSPACIKVISFHTPSAIHSHFIYSLSLNCPLFPFVYQPCLISVSFFSIPFFLLILFFLTVFYTFFFYAVFISPNNFLGLLPSVSASFTLLSSHLLHQFLALYTYRFSFIKG